MFKKILSLTIIVCFFLTTLGPLPKAHADTVLGLPAPGTMVNLSPAYEPVIIKGLTVHKDNPFLFDFIVDVGQDRMSGQPLKKEGEKLIKYFLASLAIPDKDVWVNLSPYEKNRMIPEALGQTDMGRDLLEQDYILKQITVSLIYPEKQIGKIFWDKVYAKAQQMYGTTQVPVNTFNKVWILADQAEVFEHNQTAFVVKAHLKVMLEEDYLALQKHNGVIARSEATKQSFITSGTHALASQIIRSIILPELEKEVNTGKNFANLRQIFNSIILSSWYKKNLKEALLNQVYANKSKVKGINLNDQTIKVEIYQQYLRAYKKGVFNYIKEDINTNNGETIPRKYFSGGIDEAMAADPEVTFDAAALAKALPPQAVDGRLVDLATLTSIAKTDAVSEKKKGNASVVEKLDPAEVGTPSKDAQTYGDKVAQAVFYLKNVGFDIDDLVKEIIALGPEAAAKLEIVDTSAGTGIASKILLDRLREEGIRIKKLTLVDINAGLSREYMKYAIQQLYGNYDDVVEDKIDFYLLGKISKNSYAPVSTIEGLKADYVLMENAIHVVRPVNSAIFPELGILQKKLKELRKAGEIKESEALEQRINHLIILRNQLITRVYDGLYATHNNIFKITWTQIIARSSDTAMKAKAGPPTLDGFEKIFPKLNLAAPDWQEEHLLLEYERIENWILRSKYGKFYNAVREHEASYLGNRLSEDVKDFQGITYSRLWNVRHQMAVAVRAYNLARADHLPDDEVLKVTFAAAIHDVGKTWIDYEILNFPKYTPEQMAIMLQHRAIMQQHVNFGDEILEQLGVPDEIRKIVIQHHELLNGIGYPNQREGDEISRAARILVVADIYSALRESRPYRVKGYSIKEAIAIIQEDNKGKRYDPQVVEALEKMEPSITTLEFAQEKVASLPNIGLSLNKPRQLHKDLPVLLKLPEHSARYVLEFAFEKRSPMRVVFVVGPSLAVQWRTMEGFLNPFGTFLLYGEKQPIRDENIVIAQIVRTWEGVQIYLPGYAHYGATTVTLVPGPDGVMTAQEQMEHVLGLARQARWILFKSRAEQRTYVPSRRLLLAGQIRDLARIKKAADAFASKEAIREAMEIVYKRDWNDYKFSIRGSGDQIDIDTVQENIDLILSAQWAIQQLSQGPLRTSSDVVLKSPKAEKISLSELKGIMEKLLYVSPIFEELYQLSQGRSPKLTAAESLLLKNNKLLQADGTLLPHVADVILSIFPKGPGGAHWLTSPIDAAMIVPENINIKVDGIFGEKDQLSSAVAGDILTAFNDDLRDSTVRPPMTLGDLKVYPLTRLSNLRKVNGSVFEALVNQYLKIYGFNEKYIIHGTHGVYYLKVTSNWHRISPTVIVQIYEDLQRNFPGQVVLDTIESVLSQLKSVEKVFWGRKDQLIVLKNASEMQAIIMHAVLDAYGKGILLDVKYSSNHEWLLTAWDHSLKETDAPNDSQVLGPLRNQLIGILNKLKEKYGAEIVEQKTAAASGSDGAMNGKFLPPFITIGKRTSAFGSDAEMIVPVSVEFKKDDRHFYVATVRQFINSQLKARGLTTAKLSQSTLSIKGEGFSWSGEIDFNNIGDQRALLAKDLNDIENFTLVGNVTYRARKSGTQVHIDLPEGGVIFFDFWNKRLKVYQDGKYIVDRRMMYQVTADDLLNNPSLWVIYAKLVGLKTAANPSNDVDERQAVIEESPSRIKRAFRLALVDHQNHRVGANEQVVTTIDDAKEQLRRILDLGKEVPHDLGRVGENYITWTYHNQGGRVRISGEGLDLPGGQFSIRFSLGRIIAELTMQTLSYTFKDGEFPQNHMTPEALLQALKDDQINIPLSFGSPTDQLNLFIRMGRFDDHFQDVINHKKGLKLSGATQTFIDRVRRGEILSAHENQRFIRLLLEDVYSNDTPKSQDPDILLPMLGQGHAELGEKDPLIHKLMTELLDKGEWRDAAALGTRPGGIDLNTSNGMQWKVSKDGQGVKMNIDPAMIERFRREGIGSLSPVILKITPIASIWPLVGIHAPA